jgi:hypothetical protein
VWYRSQDFWTIEREEKILDWVNQQEIESSLPMLTDWLEYETLLLPKTA